MPLSMRRMPFAFLQKNTLGHVVLAAGGSLLSLSAQADLVRDSHANLSMRNFYFNSDNRDGTAQPSKTEEWAQGFLLDFRSGYTDGTVGFGLDATAMLGLTLDSGRGRHVGGTMIPSAGDRAADQWASAGATLKMKMSKTELRLGQLMPRLPVLVSTDSRLLPQSFQGVQVQSKDIDDFTLIAGALDRARGRASTDLTGMAVSGGTQESDRFHFAGADYRASDALMLQYYVGQLQDYYLQQFAGLNHTWSLAADSSLTTDLRYFRTRADGANGSASGRSQGYAVAGYTRDGDGEIDSDLWSAAFTWRLRSHSLTLGYQSVSGGSNFVQMNQSSIDKGAGGANLYLWTDKMLLSFTRAGERTGFAQYGYDFQGLGLPGLKASVIYLKGDNIQTARGVTQSEWERDFSLDYVIQSGTFKGLGLAWRNAESHSEAARNGDQNRLMVNYSLPLF